MRHVTAALMMRNNTVFIARRPAQDRLAQKWEFPGGKIEASETPEACLRREMYEEFRVDVEVGAHFADSIYHYDHGSIRLAAYWTNWTNGHLQPTVHDRVSWVPLAELSRYDFAPADVPLVKRLADI